MSNQTSGDFMVEAAAWFVGAFKNLIMAALFVAFAFALVLPDVLMGPQFLTAYAQQQGVHLGLLNYPIPYLLSIVTTGFQYLLYRRIGAGRMASKHDGWAFILALSLAAVDTAIDVGGMTSLRYGPEQGINIIPDHPDTVWFILAGLTIGVCGFHEVILAPLLVTGAGVASGRMGTPLAWLVEGAIWLLGFLFGLLRAVFIALTVAGVFLLDLVLGPQFMFAFAADRHLDLGGLASFLPWAVSIVMTGGQALIYRRIRQGGFDTKATIALSGGVALALLDTLLDISGLTSFLYGPDVGVRVVPPGHPLAWILLALLVALLCGLWEWLAEGLLSKEGGGGSRFKF
jgi:hypothetical protein